MLTIDEAAERLRVHARTVYDMCARGELDAFKTRNAAGGHWRIRVDAEGLPRVRDVPKLKQ